MGAEIAANVGLDIEEIEGDINASTVVVKYGSKCLVDEEGISSERIEDYAQRIKRLSVQRNVIIVTSGAVAVGQRHWNNWDCYDDDVDYQVLASMGSAGIAEAWRVALSKEGLLSGQVLVTHSELKTKEAVRLQNWYGKMKGYGIPIINQNDALVDKRDKGNELAKLEIGADNDWLAADVAKCLGAEALILCTSGVDGMEVNGMLRHEVRASEIPSLRAHCYDANEEGTGSMDSKLEAAAWWVEQADMNEAYICNALANQETVLQGHRIGTQVLQ
jgi:glutamate 5-kinase